MLKKILLLLVAALIVFVGLAMTQPDEFKISRSAVIAAPADKIFAHVNDLPKWEAWSPWAKLDPNAKSSYEGPSAGVGAIMRWDGNMEVGKGALTIVESRAPQFVKYQLDFEKPMKGTSQSDFTFTPDPNGTLVTWSMYGKNNLIAKMMNLIFNCEKMVGEQFDKGLQNLKAVAEAK